MKENRILTRVYSASAAVIISVILLVCLVYKWHFIMIGAALLASIVLSSPATLALHALIWLSRKIKFEGSFPWMLLMALIPLLALLVAWLFADYVPGEIGSLLFLGIVSGYVGVLSHGISVTQFFNASENENE
jgi:O-antigen/teichoic acid export membrane protein